MEMKTLRCIKFAAWLGLAGWLALFVFNNLKPSEAREPREPRVEVRVVEKEVDYLKNPDEMVAYIRSRNPKVYEAQAWDIVSAILDAAGEFGFHPVTLLALAEVESSFNVAANSGVAFGIMQVNWGVWGSKLKDAGIATSKTDLYDPVIGVRAGAFVLREYYRQTKNLDTALNKYYGGKQTKHARKVAMAVGRFVNHMFY